MVDSAIDTATQEAITRFRLLQDNFADTLKVRFPNLTAVETLKLAGDMAMNALIICGYK